MTSKYQIVAQDCQDILKINEVNSNNYFIMDARDLSNDKALLNGFTVEDAFLIGFICGQRAERR